jgi:hypothetical protein
MKHTLRLFSCIRCHTQVVICSYCDRGNIYCGTECSQAARLQSCRLAEQRYQRTPDGRMKHALRQRRYRSSLREKVTDHSSHAPSQDDLLRSVKNKANKSGMRHGDAAHRCCFCKKSVSSWLRSGFLGHHSSLPPPNLPYLRPP